MLLRQLQPLSVTSILPPHSVTFTLKQPLLLCHSILHEQTGYRQARSLAGQFLLLTFDRVPLQSAKKLPDQANAMFQVYQDQHLRL